MTDNNARRTDASVEAHFQFPDVAGAGGQKIPAQAEIPAR
jgi:hypothetical protein